MARASVVAAFGCTLGIVPHMVAAITGLAALLHTSAVAFQTLKYLGVAYLLYMAWATLREKGALTVEEDGAPRSALKVIVTGILINILNPKLTIFFFAFLPQFVGRDGAARVLRMVELSAVFMLVTFVVFDLRDVRRGRPPPGHLAAAGDDVDAPRFRRLVRRPRRAARGDVAVAPANVTAAG